MKELAEITIAFVILILLIIGAPAIINYWHVKRKKRAFPLINVMKKLSAHFKSSPCKLTFEPFTSFKAQYNGFKFKMKYIYRSHNTVISGEPHSVSLSLSLNQHAKIKFRMLGENPGKILIGNKIDTHDPELDRMNFITYSSKVIDKVKRYLRDTANVEHLKGLIKKRWIVQLHTRRLYARTSEVEKGQDPVFIEEALNSLISLSRSASR